MTDEKPKLWMSIPGEDDWREIGKVTDFDVVPASESKEDQLVGEFVKDQLKDTSMTITTKLSDVTLEVMAQAMARVTPAMEQFYRSVMVLGTRAVAHQHPGPLQYTEKRVEHARARKLYSERLRRDRRRRRAGRRPILRSGPNVRTMFPRVQVEGVQHHGDVLGMRMIASPHLDTGQVMMLDTGLLDRVYAEKPVLQFEETKHGHQHNRIYGHTPSGYFVDEARKFTNLGDIS